MAASVLRSCPLPSECLVKTGSACLAKHHVTGTQADGQHTGLCYSLVNCHKAPARLNTQDPVPSFAGPALGRPPHSHQDRRTPVSPKACIYIRVMI